MRCEKRAKETLFMRCHEYNNLNRREVSNDSRMVSVAILGKTFFQGTAGLEKEERRRHKKRKRERAKRLVSGLTWLEQHLDDVQSKERRRSTWEKEQKQLGSEKEGLQTRGPDFIAPRIDWDAEVRFVGGNRRCKAARSMILEVDIFNFYILFLAEVGSKHKTHPGGGSSHIRGLQKRTGGRKK